MPFDPKAATDAYLATLSPAAHLKAVHYTQGGHWLLLWGWIVGVVAEPHHRPQPPAGAN